jgi:CD109 antigen
VPHEIATWVVSAFVISQSKGLCVLPDVVMVSERVSAPPSLPMPCLINQFEGTRQFFIAVTLTPAVRLGEQIGARVDVFNLQRYRIEVNETYRCSTTSPDSFVTLQALIILHASPDYRFVNVDEDGSVSSFTPRTSEGQHHVLVIVRSARIVFSHFRRIRLVFHFKIEPSNTRRIYMPIVFLSAGDIDVTIEGITGVNRDIQTVTVNVKVS